MTMREAVAGAVAVVFAVGVAGCALISSPLDDDVAEAWEEAIWTVAPDNLVTVESKVREPYGGGTAGDIYLALRTDELDSDTMIAVVDAVMAATPGHHGDKDISFQVVTRGSTGEGLAHVSLKGVISDYYVTNDHGRFVTIQVSEWDADEARPA